jgi:hypothetical protein
MATKKQETKEQETEAQVPQQVPEYMKKFMSTNMHDTASMATSSISIPRLSYRGKRFRFIMNGEEELVKELSVKIVIVGVEPDPGKFVKTYYDKGYEPGDSAPPTCSSSDGIRPDSWVSDPQSETCGRCLKNVFGSAVSRSGGKAKACKDGKILWVARLDDSETHYGLRVPVMSLKNLSEYGKYIHKNGYPLALVVTELSLDDEAEFPQLVFNHVGFVKEEQAEGFVKANTDRPWRTFTNISLLETSEPTRPAIAQPEEKATPSDPEKVKNLEDALSKW